MSSALILVDIQRDYFAGGAMELVGMDRAADNARTVLAAFRERGMPVFHVQHVSVRPGATFFLPGTAGVEIDARVAPAAGEVLVQKSFPNAFRETALLEGLRDAHTNHVTVCGAMSHMCIDATTRAAFDHGFGCSVVADACATRDLEFQGERIPAAQVHAAFMAALAVPYAKIVAAAHAV